MPTLEELFKSKELTSQGGKTAEEAYGIKNSKNIRISSSDPLVNISGMELARGARKIAGVRTSETLLEEELTGLRIIRTGSIPFIYGTDLPRLTLRTTKTLSTMKAETSGELADVDNLGGTISEVTDTISSKLGLPTSATPTYVVNQLKGSEYELSKVSNRIVDLAKIRNDSAGSLLGDFLKQSGGGTPKTVGRQLLGNGIKLGKDVIRKKLFGDGERTGLKVEGTPIKQNSYSGFKDIGVRLNGTQNINYGSDIDATPDDTPIEGKLDMNHAPYTSTVNPSEDSLEDRNDLSYTQQLEFEPIKFSEDPQRIGKFSGQAEFNREYDKNDFLEAKRGMSPISDRVNNENVFDGTTKTLGDGTTLDEKDFVPLKFTSIHRNKTVQFRATLSGLSETFSPSWDSHQFAGSPFSNYTYSGIERSVSFNFKVYSLNALEHKIGWDKINFLNSLVYPQGYYDSSAVVPPFIKLNLGDLYKNRFGFIESLSHNYDDSTPWNVTNSETSLATAGAGLLTGASSDIDMKGYRLPMITDVSVTVKFLESRNVTSNRKFYSFEPQTS